MGASQSARRPLSNPEFMRALIATLLPVLFLALAAMFDYISDRHSLRSPTRALPIAIGVCVAIPLSVPLHLYLPHTTSSLWLSRGMAAISMIIAACGILSGYKSRVAAAFVVVGGMLLAFLWILNRLVA
jgi:hypothetical protein